jgi:hypothetical protein
MKALAHIHKRICPYTSNPSINITSQRRNALRGKKKNQKSKPLKLTHHTKHKAQDTKRETKQKTKVDFKTHPRTQNRNK